MLRAALLLVTMGLMLAVPSRAQVSEAYLDTLTETIRRGDAGALADLMGDRLEVGLFGAARLYSRSQARRVLASFFRDHPAASIEVGEAVSTPDAWYAGLDYHRSGGLSPLKLYLRLRSGAGGWEVREFVVMERPGR